ncbi:hypothetical protein H6G54_05935 [Anabaena cylindrica FACHB-243]|uniref:hypothetical protein n=1 Tax=Anabaena TaxID=1163 RepID=UPI00149463F3|nr:MULTISPECIES: hypothetical protein [Anabaena]MBD2417255.1 hypothetical protein [Anabaena cylindrica FACHB-243]MBY5280401.1 hypothetical protein [Anabaena sp. CCAP 1446/1C]MBY5311670.1 hypothetical protein [Anabaena sp. CCAP 1446/1C]MCM2404928.1 hypothetical protein [Anabaena sp. CCAP 1446/1C]
MSLLFKLFVVFGWKQVDIHHYQILVKNKNQFPWILTPTEHERRQKERLIEQLRLLGVEPDI